MNNVDIINFTTPNISGDFRGFCDDLGNPWLCLKDVCDVLGIKDPNKAKNRCFPEGIQYVEMPIEYNNQYNSSAVRSYDVIFINEPNFYKLVFTSRNPVAYDFSKWVCYDVLPSIRKTGAYITPDVLDNLIAHPEEIPGFLEMQEKLRETETENRELRENYETLQGNFRNLHKNRENINTRYQKLKDNYGEAMDTISQNQHKVDFFDRWVEAHNGKSASEMAAKYGFRSANDLNYNLMKLGILKKQGGTWMLTSNYASSGYVIYREGISRDGSRYSQLLWTAKGEIWMDSVMDNFMH